MEHHDEQGMYQEPEPQAGDSEDPEETQTSEPETGSIRGVIARAYPDAVPELITGETVDEMLASVPAAREAYQRVAEAARTDQPDPVPASGGVRTPDAGVDAMTPALKIREGLRRR